MRIACLVQLTRDKSACDNQVCRECDGVGEQAATKLIRRSVEFRGKQYRGLPAWTHSLFAW
jgi:hydrogenase maturation factor